MLLPKKRLMMLISLLTIAIIPTIEIMGMLLHYLILIIVEHPTISLEPAVAIEILLKTL